MPSFTSHRHEVVGWHFDQDCFAVPLSSASLSALFKVAMVSWNASHRLCFDAKSVSNLGAVFGVCLPNDFTLRIPELIFIRLVEQDDFKIQVEDGSPCREAGSCPNQSCAF